MLYDNKSNSFGKFEVRRSFGMFSRQIWMISHDFRVLWKKSFFGHLGQFRAYLVLLASSEYPFLEIDKNGYQLPHNHFYASGVAPIYTKTFLGLQRTFCICMMGSKSAQKNSTSQKASLVKISKKPFLTTEIVSWLLRSISFLNWQKWLSAAAQLFLRLECCSHL